MFSAYSLRGFGEPWNQQKHYIIDFFHSIHTQTGKKDNHTFSPQTEAVRAMHVRDQGTRMRNGFRSQLRTISCGFLAGQHAFWNKHSPNTISLIFVLEVITGAVLNRVNIWMRLMIHRSVCVHMIFFCVFSWLFGLMISRFISSVGQREWSKAKTRTTSPASMFAKKSC